MSYQMKVHVKVSLCLHKSLWHRNIGHIMIKYVVIYSYIIIIWTYFASALLIFAAILLEIKLNCPKTAGAAAILVRFSCIITNSSAIMCQNQAQHTSTKVYMCDPHLKPQFRGVYTTKPRFWCAKPCATSVYTPVSLGLTHLNLC